MKEKSVTFCFLKSKAKEKANFPKTIRERVTFSRKFRFLPSKLMLLTQLPAEATAMEYWKQKTKDYHQKLNIRIASRIAELPQQFRTYDLSKLGNKF